MNSRQGFELAVGTLVVIILGLIIVGAGTILIWKLIDEGDVLVTDLTNSQRQTLTLLLNKGQLMAVTPANIEIGVGEHAIFATAIQNRLSQEMLFTINVDGFDESGTPLGSIWRQYLPPPSIGSNEQAEFLVLVNPPPDAVPGVYTFVIAAYDDASNPYDEKRFFTVTVR